MSTDDWRPRSIFGRRPKFSNVFIGPMHRYLAAKHLPTLQKPRQECEPIEYGLNSLYFRSDEFETRRDINLLVVGCSATFCEGVSAEFMWPRKLADLIENDSGKSVAIWNLGMPGESNDYISRATLWAQHNLVPDLVVVLFTFAGRREYFMERGDPVKFNPAMPAVPGTPEEKIVEFFRNCGSEAEDERNFFKNYKLVEMSLKLASIPAVFSMLDDRKQLVAMVDQSSYVPFPVAGEKSFDFGSNCRFATPPTCERCKRNIAPRHRPACAEDSVIGGHHWGRQSCATFAQNIFKHMVNCGSISSRCSPTAENG